MASNRFTTQIKNNHPGLNPEKPLTVIIPIAGIGNRMKSYGPKCLLEVPKKNKSIIEEIIASIKNTYPYSDIIVCVGFEADKVIKSLLGKVRIVENRDYNETNITESIRLCMNVCMTDHVMIVYGDLIFSPSAISEITKHGSCALVDSKLRFKESEIGVNVVDKKITNFAYGLDTKWAHIIFLENEELRFFKKQCVEKRKSKLYPFEIFNKILDKGLTINAIEPRNMRIKEIDSSRDLFE